VFFQYVLTLAGAAIFLFTAAQMPISVKALSALLIVLAIVNCGALFELRKWVYLAEFARLICTLSFIGIIMGSQLPVLLLGLTYLLISTLWLIKLRHIFYTPATTRKGELV
jgi:hypothetical protein